LLPVVGAEADRVLEALKEPMSDARRAKLHTVAVGLHAQAGLLAFHTGCWSGAYRDLATALSIAGRSGNPTLHAQALSSFAALTEALDLARAHGYAMGVQRIRAVRTRFPTSWADLPCVVALDQRLRRRIA
jgi:hypothetical protein